MTDDPSGRKTPPENENDWGYIWGGAHGGHDVKKSPIFKLIIALEKNWKAAAFVVVFVAWVNRPEIVAAIQVLAGGAK